MFDFFHDVKELADKGNANAKAVLQSWADGEWFHHPSRRPRQPKLTVFKVTGETNTDDLSPGPGRLVPPRHPAARPGYAEEPASGHRGRRAGHPWP